MINKSEIQSRETTAVSMMPPGLFDTLSDSEVVDLVAHREARRGTAPFGYLYGIVFSELRPGSVSCMLKTVSASLLTLAIALVPAARHEAVDMEMNARIGKEGEHSQIMRTMHYPTDVYGLRG